MDGWMLTVSASWWTGCCQFINHNWRQRDTIDDVQYRPTGTLRQPSRAGRGIGGGGEDQPLMAERELPSMSGVDCSVSMNGGRWSSHRWTCNAEDRDRWHRTSRQEDHTLLWGPCYTRQTTAMYVVLHCQPIARPAELHAPNQWLFLPSDKPRNDWF